MCNDSNPRSFSQKVWKETVVANKSDELFSPMLACVMGKGLDRVIGSKMGRMLSFLAFSVIFYYYK